MRERGHGVDGSRGRQPSSALAERGEDGNSPADDALHVDFGSRIALEADHERRSRHIVEACVLDPELVRRSLFDVDRGRHAGKARTDECQTRLVLPYRGASLSLERGINERVLPAWRRRACPDAVFAADEVHILGDVAAFVHAGQAGSDAEFDVRREAVLCVLCADADGARIPVLNLEVHVAQRRIERSRVCVFRRVPAAGLRPAKNTSWRSWLGSSKPGVRGPSTNAGRCAPYPITRMLGQTYSVREIRYRPSGTKTMPSAVDSWTASIAFWMASVSSATPSPTAPNRSRVR